MTVFTNFLRSLLLTIIFSFVAPLFVVGVCLFSLSLIGNIPGVQHVSSAIALAIIRFLATFGSGTPLRGIFVICLTCSFVGALFDTYVYYKYQILRRGS